MSKDESSWVDCWSVLLLHGGVVEQFPQTLQSKWIVEASWLKAEWRLEGWQTNLQVNLILNKNCQKLKLSRKYGRAV